MYWGSNIIKSCSVLIIESCQETFLRFVRDYLLKNVLSKNGKLLDAFTDIRLIE